MPDYAYKPSPDATRPADPTGPLRDWLSTVSRREARAEETSRRGPEGAQDDERRVVEMPRLRPAPREARPEADEAGDVEALMAENMVLRAKLQTEGERYEAVQEILADELRSLRALVREEAERAEDLRAERDIWMARAEALAQPIFQRR